MDELLQALNQAGIRYLLIGVQAIRLDGLPRFAAKEAANRPEDQADLRFLRELRAQGLL